ncbi:MAG: peroxiredoxin [Candidatus Eisenbacteria sp.]|nr:peroxiredoxin [Candidatus Eisenbacteria bacterium]
MSTSLKPGDKAPSFSAPSWDGSTVKLSDFSGSKNVVLFFYVRDNTSGCTHEARALRDALGDLTKRSAVIMGVSTDGVESHERFATNNELTFPLLADSDGKIAKAYGVLRKTGRAARATFLIGKDGTILHAWPKVSITGHADEIMARLDELT